MIDEIEAGWNDVLRRARRRTRRGLVLAGVVTAVLIGGGSAAAVALTQDANALRLPMDEIGGSSVVSVIDPHTRRTIIVAGKWRRHDGVCFLVPHVRAGCLRHGQRTPLIAPPEGLLRRLGPNRLILVSARRHGVIELVDAKTGRVVARVKVGR